jgi:carbamate kinase
MAEAAKTVVVALGGNAILRPSQVGTFEEQLVNCDDSARRIARMVANGYRVILTHGNGPQVGNILIQNDAAAKLVAPMPMDVCGAESQGQIGYMLEQCLHNHLRRLKVAAPVATLLTENVVDGKDPAFANPSKPVGPFYSEGKAKELMIEQGLAMREDAGRGWRRVVPSPEPIHILQKEAIALLVHSGAVVICSGGGGIPVMRQRDGSLAGVAAVIDKDLAAARLALDVGADILLILTDVPHVYVNYRRPDQAALHRVTIAEMQGYQDAGHFKAGSMGPKVEAALRFARAGGTSIIAGLLDALHALEGTSGTWIVPDAASAPTEGVAKPTARAKRGARTPRAKT